MKRTTLLLALLGALGACTNGAALPPGDGGGAGGGGTAGGAGGGGAGGAAGAGPGGRADAAAPRDAGAGPACGPTTCASGMVCCNASCGICTPPGGACILIACEPPRDAGAPACRVDGDCRLFDDYCTGCDCRALARTDPDPKCGGPGVRCLTPPCMGKVAACEAGRCVVRDAALRWYYTCGDPVCRGWTAKPDVPRCSTQKEGDPCKVAGERCDPGDGCNRLLVCAASDPTKSGGSCPISRRDSKREVKYLSPQELRRYQDELMGLRLATWRYRHDPGRERLGFIVDDHEDSAATDGARDMVDLYGYTSLAVATLQLQARAIDELRREVQRLQRRLRALEPARR